MNQLKHFVVLWFASNPHLWKLANFIHSLIYTHTETERERLENLKSKKLAKKKNQHTQSLAYGIIIYFYILYYSFPKIHWPKDFSWTCCNNLIWFFSSSSSCINGERWCVESTHHIYQLNGIKRNSYICESGIVMCLSRAEHITHA